MLFKRRVFFAVIMLMCLWLLLGWFAHLHARDLKRDPQVLMNTYYQIKSSRPNLAHEALQIILRQDENYLPALIELSQWLIQEARFDEAIPLLERLHKLLPRERKYTIQLAQTYYKTGDWVASRRLFLELSDHKALRAMASFVPNYKDWADAQFFDRSRPGSYLHPYTLAYSSPYLDAFYALKKAKDPKARAYIEMINRTHPMDAKALEEAGVLAIQEQRIEDAVELFTRAYAITGEPRLAMQIGYLYSGLGLNKHAYNYFERATVSKNEKLSLLAEDAMTRLAGQQTKAFPKPYYGEFFFTPFTQNRFGITVNQFIGRLGVELPLPMAPRVYSFTRRTQDNRENNTGELTQLYEDNVWVTGMGGQLFPFEKVPLFIYVEGGAAHDLFFRARRRWRPDLRAGFMYYQETGARPSYYSKPKYSTDYYSTWYAEMTYFSRYDNNVIASIRTHQGIRLIQYKSSMIDLFVRGRVIEDTRRDFYNNFAELGPALAIVPSNRYNVEIHLDYINGMYLPAGGAQRNPYNKYYSNKRALLLAYVKI